MSQSLKETIEFGKAFLQSSFWGLIEKRLLDQRAKASRRCELDSDTRVSQGEIRALDFILGHGEGKTQLVGVFQKVIDDMEDKWRTVANPTAQ